jgi:hypothetical protein
MKAWAGYKEIIEYIECSYIECTSTSICREKTSLVAPCTIYIDSGRSRQQNDKGFLR